MLLWAPISAGLAQGESRTGHAEAKESRPAPVAPASELPLRKTSCKDSCLKPKREGVSLLVSATQNKKIVSDSETACIWLPFHREVQILGETGACERDLR